MPVVLNPSNTSYLFSDAGGPSYPPNGAFPGGGSGAQTAINEYWNTSQTVFDWRTQRAYVSFTIPSNVGSVTAATLSFSGFYSTFVLGASSLVGWAELTAPAWSYNASTAFTALGTTLPGSNFSNGVGLSQTVLNLITPGATVIFAFADYNELSGIFPSGYQNAPPAGQSRTSTESFAIQSATLSITEKITQTAHDTAGVTDSASFAITQTQKIGDTAGVTDSADKSLLLSGTAPDLTGLSEAVSVTITVAIDDTVTTRAFSANRSGKNAGVPPVQLRLPSRSLALRRLVQ